MSGSVLFPNSSASPSADKQSFFGSRPSDAPASSPLFGSPSQQKKYDTWGYSGQPFSTPYPTSFRDPGATAAGDPGSFTPTFGPPVPPSSTSHSLFFRDLNATHTPSGARIPSPLGVNPTAAAAAALWRDSSDGPVEPPPPPCFTLEDQIDRTQSPEAFTPLQPSHSYLPTPAPTSSSYPAPRSAPYSIGQEYGARMAFADASPTEMLSPSSPLQWSPAAVGPPGATPWHSLRPAWSPNGGSMLGSGGRNVSVATPSGASPGGGRAMADEATLLTLPPADEVVRPPRSARKGGNAEEECWVTLYGFSADDTNVVLREFEKCGRILGHHFGPGGANWMHVQYASPYEAQRALAKNGLQVSGHLMVGVKRLDEEQLGALSSNGSEGTGGRNKSVGGNATTPVPSAAASRPYYLDARDGGQGGVAQPKQSRASQFFGWLLGS